MKITEWVPLEDKKPAKKQKVYVVCANPKKGGGCTRFQTIAVYIPEMTVEEEAFMHDDFQGEGDLCKLENKYYTPEGFYEYQIEAEMNWKISFKVTHWMPLIELP